MNAIPYSKQEIDRADINAVRRILSSDRITQGPKVDEFEHAVAAYCGARYAVAVSSGSAALHLAVLAAGVGEGEEVITTPISFLATSNCILYARATPVFADIDYETVNIDPASILDLITKRTRLILPVDFAGLPAAMCQIKEIASRDGLIVIEDACHALGAEYGKGRVGSCRFSDMTVFSFHPVKHITTGEGGCITTNSKVYYEKLKALRSHGVHRTRSLSERFGGWYYEMKELGFNYRITDFQCALGMSQLKKIKAFLNRRAQIARRYNQAFRELQDYLKIPAQKVGEEKHAWHLYLLRLKMKKASRIRRLIYDHLRANGINAQVHYIPIYKQPFYQKLFRGKKFHCPHAERYYQEVISLPIFTALTEQKLERTVDAVRNFFQRLSLNGRSKKQRLSRTSGKAIQ